MAYNPAIKSMIIDSYNYFAAENVDGGVRVGLHGSTVYILRPDHKYVDDIKGCESEAEVEHFFDLVFEDGGFVYA